MRMKIYEEVSEQVMKGMRDGIRIMMGEGVGIRMGIGIRIGYRN